MEMGVGWRTDREAQYKHDRSLRNEQCPSTRVILIYSGSSESAEQPCCRLRLARMAYR